MEMLFENRYSRSKEFYREYLAYSYFLRPVFLILWTVFTLILILDVLSLPFPGILPYLSPSGIYIAVYTIISIFMIVRYFRAVDISYKRDLEINNGNPIGIMMIVTADEIEACFADSETGNHFSYQSVRRVKKTRNYYVLLTEAKHSIVFRRDGFVTGTPDEFLSFIKNRITKCVKKSRKQIALIWLACVVAAIVAVSLYITNGRTVFENRREPSDKDMARINEIIAYEQERLAECLELVSRYDDRISELGIEVRTVVRRTRAVNHQGLVEDHDWERDMWLPKYYHSGISCGIYKDGELLMERISPNTSSLFIASYWLLQAGKNEPTFYNDMPFKDFDRSFNDLLSQVFNFISG